MGTILILYIVPSISNGTTLRGLVFLGKRNMNNVEERHIPMRMLAKEEVVL